MSPTEGVGGNPEDLQVTGNPDPNVTADNDDDNSEDPIEAAITARLALEADRIRREVRQDIETKQRREQASLNSQANARALQQSFAHATKQAHDMWRQLQVFDKDGNPAQLPDTLFEEIVAKPYQGHNATVQQGVASQVLQNLADMALASLPEDAREEFSQRATGKPIDEWLKIYGELRAPHTEYAEMSKKERLAAEKAAEARAKAGTVARVGGTPRQGTDRASNPSPDLNTQSGLARALVAGTINEDEYRKRRAVLEGG